MLDLHSHILPGVDDGARSLEESTQMLQEARNAGVTEIVATPHLYSRRTDMGRIDEAYAQLYPVAEGMGIRLHRGFEVYFDAVQETSNITKYCVRWNLPEKVMLLELNWQEYPERAAGMISEWIRQGVRLVIVHPERYQFVQDDPKIVAEWRSYGCWIQSNAGSYWKPVFAKERTIVRRLLKEGLVDFIASDAHRPEHYERLGRMVRAFPPNGLPVPVDNG
jgi:protein-tyrosine phosphatase